MTFAPDHSTLAVSTEPTLLPAREMVLARLAEQLPTTDARPAMLLIIGLTPRDDGRTTPPSSTLAEVTTLLAGSLRADDWLGSSGPGEFAIVMVGPAVGGRVAADRLVAAIAALETPGLSAAAGIAPLAAHLAPDEALRRATVTLTAARRVGPGTVIQHREPY